MGRPFPAACRWWGSQKTRHRSTPLAVSAPNADRRAHPIAASAGAFEGQTRCPSKALSLPNDRIPGQSGPSNLPLRMAGICQKWTFGSIGFWHPQRLEPTRIGHSFWPPRTSVSGSQNRHWLLRARCAPDQRRIPPYRRTGDGPRHLGPRKATADTVVIRLEADQGRAHYAIVNRDRG